MKKKIKDLTLEECKKICDKDVYCDNCRLQLGEKKRCYYIFLEDLKFFTKNILESKVEVDD